MRILLIGSSRRSAEQEKADQASAASKAKAAERVLLLRRAADEIGRELAQGGHTLLVGSDEETDVDPHAVRGALAQKADAQVEVHVPHGTPEPYGKLKDPSRVKVERHQFTDWDVTVMEVVRDRVDGVIALGGRVGVVQAGLAAWMLQRPVIPVASFEGGAQTLWEYGSARRDHFYRTGLSDVEVDRLAGPWGTSGSGLNAKFVLRALDKVAKATAIARVSRRLLSTVVLLTLLALAAWVAFLTIPLQLSSAGKIDLNALFPCVGSAGILGTMLQTLRTIRGGEAVTERKLVVDLVLGLIAGVVSTVLYLIAQVAVAGEVQLLLKNTDYVRVALIVSMISLFAASYLDKALARFDEVSERVLRGEVEDKKNSDQASGASPSSASPSSTPPSTAPPSGAPTNAPTLSMSKGSAPPKSGSSATDE